MRALEKIKEISGLLKDAGIETAVKEAEILSLDELMMSSADLYRDDPEINDGMAAALDAKVRRRAGREPLQYITGSVQFLSLDLQVGPGVLIPRPETELVATRAIGMARESMTGGVRAVLDLCTGSGCLALAMARAFPHAGVTGIDRSGDALRYARINALNNGIDNVWFLAGELFEPLAGGRRFDCVTANPPYIRTGDLKALQPEIRDWEPAMALDGGRDGMDFYRCIIPRARDFLKFRGFLVLEVGDGMAPEVKEIMTETGYVNVTTARDYSGVERISQGQWIK